MEHTPELKKALVELQRITGITLDVQLHTPEDATLALSQIRSLTTAYKEKYNRTHFLQSLLTGELPPYDINERALRLHVDPDEQRVVLLIETKANAIDTVMEVLKHLFPARTKTYLVTVTKQHIAILKPVKASETREDINTLCRMIVDTLNTEALVHVWIAYSSMINSLFELSAAFRENALALRVGKLFYSEQDIFSSHKLGIGRLIYELPLAVCEDFLKEIFGGEIPDAFDEETMTIINKFIQNNLNIAETARQLHMHRNTLIYRLEQMEERTGLNLRRFEDAMTFKIATMVINYLKTEMERKNHNE